MRPGEIYRHAEFYVDPASAELKPKFFLVLAITGGKDCVFRLLTSKRHGRPTEPPCYHGDPYPGLYLGVIGGQLAVDSWLDLRGQGDFDGYEFAVAMSKGLLTLEAALDSGRFKQALACSAGADDTTREQERLIRDVLAALP